MKKLIYLLVLIVNYTAFCQETALEFQVPNQFFKKMFRSPTDKYLVAWSGAVKIVVKISSNQEIEIVGAIEFVEDFLNTEMTNLERRQFKFNMNSPSKRISTSNKTTWAGHCGYNPYQNVSFNSIRNGGSSGWPPEITSEVWGQHLSEKKSVTGTLTNKEGRKESVSIFFHATSIFYYHKIKPQSLTGEITRDDDYKACGKIRMYRLGPGYPRFNEKTDVIGDKFEFNEALFLGEYQVQYLWEDGTFEVLERNYIYDPFRNSEGFEYELKTFEGEINGTLVDTETHKPVKNQTIKLKPICSESELPEFETKTDGDGKYKFTEVPTGFYNVVTKGAPNTMAGLTKNPTLRLREIEVKKNSKYDIFLHYNAPKFTDVKLVWRNATIKFPEEDEKIQFFDMVAFRNSGNYDNPTGTDGKPLKIPYTTVIPGIGKQTLYGWPESETATPEIISIRSLGDSKSMIKFKVSLDEDSLNSCNISQDNNGPIYLDINFDLFGMYDAGGDLWQQVDVGTREDKVWNATKGNSLNGYPLAFKRHKFTNSEIEKFKNSEEFEIFLSGLKATLKIEFKPLENE